MSYLNRKNGIILTSAVVIGSFLYFGLTSRSQNNENQAVEAEVKTAQNQEVSHTQEPPVNPPAVEKVDPKKTGDAPVEKVPAKESLSVLQQKFKETANQVLQELPTLEELRKLPHEEVHQTPGRIIQAGVELGKIAEMLEAHPELGPEAVQFYDKCSSHNEYPSSVRALCFSHLKTIDPKLAADSQVPDAIRDLADRI